MFLGWPNSWSCRELLRTLLPRAEARFNPIATEIIIRKEIEGPPPSSWFFSSTLWRRGDEIELQRSRVWTERVAPFRRKL